MASSFNKSGEICIIFFEKTSCQQHFTIRNRETVWSGAVRAETWESKNLNVGARSTVNAPVTCDQSLLTGPLFLSYITERIEIKSP